MQVIDDDGKVYQTSVNSLLYLLNGHAKKQGNFITTVRLPLNAAPHRYKKSELYDPNGLFKGDAAKSLTTARDSYSVKVQEEQKTKKAYEDKNVW